MNCSKTCNIDNDFLLSAQQILELFDCKTKSNIDQANIVLIIERLSAVLLSFSMMLESLHRELNMVDSLAALTSQENNDCIVNRKRAIARKICHTFIVGKKSFEEIDSLSNKTCKQNSYINSDEGYIGFTNTFVNVNDCIDPSDNIISYSKNSSDCISILESYISSSEEDLSDNEYFYTKSGKKRKRDPNYKPYRISKKNKNITQIDISSIDNLCHEHNELNLDSKCECNNA